MRKYFREYRETRIIKGRDWIKQPFLDLMRFLNSLLSRRINQNAEKISINNIKEMIFIRRNRLGDAITLLPLLQQLKTINIHLKATVLCTPYNAPIFELSPAVDVVMVLPERYLTNRYLTCIHPTMRMLKKIKFDALFAASGNYSSANAWLSLCINAKHKCGVVSKNGSLMDTAYTHPIKLDQIPPDLHQVQKMALMMNYLISNDVKFSLNLLPRPHIEPKSKSNSNTPIGRIALCPLVNRVKSRWPLESWSALSKQLTNLGYRFDWIGNKPNHANEKLISTTSVSDLIVKLDNYELIVCSEGGVSHLASALDKKIVVLSGVNIRKTWAPWKSLSVLLEKTNHIDDITCTEVIDNINMLLAKTKI